MQAWFRYQLQLFALALGFFSRLPIPQSVPYSESRMNRAGRYFSLVGLLLGALCASVYGLAQWLFPGDVAVFVVMVFSLLLTGAFHEDGLADMADGMGGGMTLEKRLTIMKDSRIGTYGASALVMALLGKWVMLTALTAHVTLIPVLIVSYTFSRAVAATFIFDMPYVSDSETSKSKPLATRQTVGELAGLLVTGIAVTLVFPPVVSVALVLVALVFRVVFKRWLMKRIGGFTGDCLGAAQQLVELMTYLVLVAFAHHGMLA